MVLGTTVADENGEWVVVPEVALGADEHLVSIGAVSDDGAETVADITMAIKVGETAEDSPLVALLPQSETDIPKLLQSPDDRPVAEESVVAEMPQPTGEGVQTVRASEAAPAAVVPALAPRSLAWGAAASLLSRAFPGAAVHPLPPRPPESRSVPLRSARMAPGRFPAVST